MKITVRKDGEGYLAEVKGHAHLFAWSPTRAGARAELKNIAEMMLDYHLVNKCQLLKPFLSHLRTYMTSLVQ